MSQYSSGEDRLVFAIGILLLTGLVLATVVVLASLIGG